MAALLIQYFNIAFLMGKPQDLPAGRSQLSVALIISFATYVLASVTHYSLVQSIGTAIIDLALSGLLIYVALVALGKTARFEQSYGALCGAGAVLNLAALPIFLARSDGAEAGAGVTPYADFLLLVWSLSVLAHVIRHTFEIRMVYSVILAFCYFLFIVSLVGSIWAPQPGSVETELSHLQSSGKLMVASSLTMV